MPLEAEQIDELLVARSLGELSPAAEVLLDDYLAAHPEWAKQAEAYRSVVVLAARAMASAAGPAVPPFPAEAIRRQAAWATWAHRAGWTARTAAAIAAGFLAAMLLFSETGRPNRPARPAAPPPVPVAAARTGGDFWSVNREAVLARHPPRREYTPLVWKSVTREPELGDRL